MSGIDLDGPLSQLSALTSGLCGRLALRGIDTVRKLLSTTDKELERVPLFKHRGISRKLGHVRTLTPSGDLEDERNALRRRIANLDARLAEHGLARGPFHAADELFARLPPALAWKLQLHISVSASAEDVHRIVDPEFCRIPVTDEERVVFIQRSIAYFWELPTPICQLHKCSILS